MSRCFRPRTPMRNRVSPWSLPSDLQLFTTPWSSVSRTRLKPTLRVTVWPPAKPSLMSAESRTVVKGGAEWGRFGSERVMAGGGALGSNRTR